VATVSVLAALAGATAAQAHVTLAPKEVPAEAFTVLDVRVPNERDDASTVKVEVQMPPGVVGVSYEAVPGWTTKVAKQKLDQPIETPDGPITEAVSTVTWTGSGKGDGAIAPGQFGDFPISLQIPGKAGDVLTFKALQTYSNGEVVRWIGSPTSDEPAPTVTVTAANAEVPAAATPAPAAATDESDDSGSSDGLAIAALVVGALGLLAGVGALIAGRRRSAA
jgi:uncharacterized protein